MRYKDKTVYITQASGAVNEAIAVDFAKEGANLVLGGPSDELVKKAEALGSKVLVTNTDITSFEGGEKVLAEILAVFPRVDVLVFTNNRVVRRAIEDFDQEFFKKELDYNAKAAFATTRAIGGHMAGLGNGKIVYVTSIHNDKPTGSAPMFSISKGVINMLCKEAAIYYGRQGLQVNVLAPGALEGDDDVFMSEYNGAYVHMDARIPRDYAGKPEEISSIATFLASQDANYLNGAFIRADGGFMLNYGPNN